MVKKAGCDARILAEAQDPGDLEPVDDSDEADNKVA